MSTKPTFDDSFTKAMDEVKEVLQAEEEADKIISHAKQEAEKIIFKAKQAALEQVAQEKESINIDHDKRLKEKVKQLEQEQKTILQEAESHSKDLQRMAAKNREKAERILVERILAGKD